MNSYSFTERIRKVLAMAREEAARLDHTHVGTEHLLLGLVLMSEGVAATALKNLGVDLGDIRQRIEETVRSGTSSEGLVDLTFTSRAKKVLELAMSHAREFNHSYVGTEHLLLGLIAEEEGIAAQILVDLGVTLEKARAETLRLVGGEGSPATFSKARPLNQASGPFQAEQSVQYVTVQAAQYGVRLREVTRGAQRVATERGTLNVTPVHFALALLEHGEGVANIALERLGVDITAATVSLNDFAPIGTDDVSKSMPFDLNPATKRVMHTMLEFVRTENARIQETHHLLMALLAVSPEVGSVFSAQGVSFVDVRDEARKIVG